MRTVNHGAGDPAAARSTPRHPPDPIPLPVAARSGGGGRTPWAWIPSLYLAEGLPYVVVMSVSVIMYKRFGVSNTDIALFTSWLYLPWVIKPLWSPVVDILGTRRNWIWATQLVIGAGLACVALALPGPHFFRWSLVFFWLMAFDSATHDIAADGFYILATSEPQQAFFVGVRTMFYRGATIFGQGLLVVLAGVLETRTGNPRLAWSFTLGALAVLFLGFGLWHRFVLPRPATDRPGDARRIPEFTRAFLATFGSFFQKPRMPLIVLFLLVYRLGEAQLVKLVAPFLLDARAQGGLALTTAQVGVVYGTVGIAGAHARRDRGRLDDRAQRAQGVAVADDARHSPAGRRLPVARVHPAFEHRRDPGLHRGRAVRLRLRLHRLSDVHDLARARPAPDRALRDLHRPDGARDDGPRHVERVAPGPHRLPALLPGRVLATVPSFLVALGIPLEAGFGKKSAA
jgi:hypothetical protein